MTLTFAAIAGIALIAALVMRKIGAWPKWVPWLMLVAGLGVGGLVGDVIRRAMLGALSGAEAGTRALLGTAVPLALVVVVVLCLVHWMRSGAPHKWAPWFALAVCPLLAVAGFGGLISGAQDVAASLAAGIGGFLGTLT